MLQRPTASWSSTSTDGQTYDASARKDSSTPEGSGDTPSLLNAESALGNASIARKSLITKLIVHQTLSVRETPLLDVHPPVAVELPEQPSSCAITLLNRDSAAK